MATADARLSATLGSQWPLFEGFRHTRISSVDPAVKVGAIKLNVADAVTDTFVADVDDRLLEIYARANDPSNPLELRDLYLGRVEYELGAASHRRELAARWAATRPLRRVSADDVLHSRATVRFVKELFNWFFRDDLYGDLRSDDHIILSSGSADEEAYGLPDVLKECVRYAVTRDWYGYSDSRGRSSARQAIAAYESTRAGSIAYDESNVAITMGGTFAISTLADFIALRGGGIGPALCAIPNYPPLVESVARRMPVQLVPTPCQDGVVSLDALIDALTPSISIVLLQTVTNPTGAAVSERDLERLIDVASPSTMILLDECHECLGPRVVPSVARRARNVVRVSSISKTWSAPGLKLGWILAASDFIDEYYEYASTTFGGPPSLYYTLIEVMARMERWLLEDLEMPGATEFSEFQALYGLTPERLAQAFVSYRHDRIARETALVQLREAAIADIAGPLVTVVRPRYSINMAVHVAGADDSYKCFRTLLSATGVAVFPSILTFCLGGGAVRVTTARTWDDLSRATKALERWGDIRSN